jgi:isoprenylcysteine carboxyl methyltransferase (ICMT) family protein YpbQ
MIDLDNLHCPELDHDHLRARGGNYKFGEALTRTLSLRHVFQWLLLCIVSRRDKNDIVYQLTSLGFFDIGLLVE